MHTSSYESSKRILHWRHFAIVALASGLLGHSLPVHGDDIDQAIDQAKSLSRAFRNAAESATPSVVMIISKLNADIQDLAEQLPFELPPGFELPDGHVETRSVGSGIIIDASGIILTNSHVVRNADEVRLRLSDGREFDVSDIKTDRLSDLAIVRFDAPDNLKAATLGNSDKLMIGDWVIAIGSPFELETTVSAGIISGKGRSVRQIRRNKMLQTDAAINPGNSGGPLVNLDGEVVGINTAIASSSGGYQGIGFAIPVDRAKWVARELIENGKVKRAYLGIEIRDIDADLARTQDIPIAHGVLVVRIIRDSPAEEAGLQNNDVIIEFSGVKVRDSRDLQLAVEQKPFDSKQHLVIFREGKQIELEVTLKPLPEADQLETPDELP